MDCGKCGLDNRPYALACTSCGQKLQDEASAWTKRQEFDALPPETRAEFDKKYVEAERALVRSGGRKRRLLITNVVVGALLFPVIANLIFPSKLLWTAILLPVDMACGAVALGALAKVGGGMGRGLLYTIAGYCLSTGIHSRTYPDIHYGQSVAWAYGFMVAGALGLYFGWKTDEERAEHSIS